MNKHVLNGLIKDVQLQLQNNIERLDRRLSKNEIAQILGENQAIENTIAKLQDDLKGVNGMDEENKEELEGKEEQQSFTKPLGLVKKEAIAKQFQDAFSDNPQVKQDDSSKEWEEAFSTETQIGIANKNQY